MRFNFFLITIGWILIIKTLDSLIKDLNQTFTLSSLIIPEGNDKWSVLPKQLVLGSLCTINVESDNTSYSTFSMLKKSMYGSQITCYLGLNLKNLSMGPFPSSEFLQR